MASKITCPKCGQLTKQGGYATWQVIVAICGFPIGLLALLAGREPTSCTSCGYSWKGSTGPRLVIERNETIHTIGRTEAHAPTNRDIYAELTKLDDLKNKGILSAEEFEVQKKKLLS